MKVPVIHLKSAFLALTIVISAILIFNGCKAPQETAVLKIYKDNTLLESVSPQDFLAVFTKNNLNNEPLTKDGVEEYLELFINYKLKVKEAEALGMDTLSSFKTELHGYRDQLAKPYLNDQAVTDRLIQEAWERMLYDVRASHILVAVNKDASPKDTLAAWKKIAEAREKLLKGDDFARVAATYSDDPYAKDIPGTESSPGRKGNRGDLGYFTVFDMVYPFENAAYNTPVGTASNIVRSNFGYHLLKVTDKKPSMGKAFIAHVYVPHPRSGLTEDSAAAEKKIHEIYAEYQKGDITFEDLAKTFSEDVNNARNGGVLRWFNVHGLVPEFVATINNMKINDVSAPIMTMYGWHIIKLLGQEKPEVYEKELPNIKQRLAKDTRSLLSRDEAITGIKKQFGYKAYPANINKLQKTIDSTIFLGTWVMKGTALENNRKPVIRIGNKTYTMADFGSWVEKRQVRSGSGDITYFITERMKDFSNEKVLEYKEKKLESLYPEFKALMKEYRDGILLFDLMDKKVWTYAIQDTTGLEAFYEKHKHEHRWDLRVEASVYTGKKEELLQQARQLLLNDREEQDILDSLNKESSINLVLKTGKFQAADNALVDAHPWDSGVTQVKPLPDDYPGAPSFYFIHYKDILPPDVKQLSEIRGLMISQYQEQLEKDWLNELRTKYRIETIRPELEKLYP